MLLFILLSKGERNAISLAFGLSGEHEDLQAMSGKKEVLHHAESMNMVSLNVKELESQLPNQKDDKRTLPNVTLKLNDGAPNEFDFKNNAAKQTVILKHLESAAKPLTAKHSTELTLNHEEKSNLTNGEVQGVIDDHSGALSSQEEHALQPGLHLETGVGDAQPEKTQDRFNWVKESEDSRSGPRSRCRRSWLWNQFFVIEEYRGPEPVLIGRVSLCHNQSACTSVP